MATSKNFKWPTWLCENEKQAITRERKLFSEIRQLKTFGVQQRPGCYVHFVAHTTYAAARLVPDTQTDYSNPYAHAHRALTTLERSGTS